MSDYDQNAANDAGYAAGAVGTYLPNIPPPAIQKHLTDTPTQRAASTAPATTSAKTSNPSKTSPRT